MLFDELKPIFQELIQQPAAFMGGFFSGVLHLNLREEPWKSWLEQNGVDFNKDTDDKDGPQSINIE